MINQLNDPGYPFMAKRPPLSEAITRFKQAAEDVLNRYESHQPAYHAQVSPEQLIDAIEQFLHMVIRTDRIEGDTGVLANQDVDAAGDYGLSLLHDLSEWAKLLGSRAAYNELQKVSLAATDWIVRHHGRIRNLEAVVDAFSEVSNELREPEELEYMAQFMGQVLRASADAAPGPGDKGDKGKRPHAWRVLQINRGIIATRSYNVKLMQHVFDELVQAVPEDAPGFFREGMEQMEALNYPPDVRDIMTRYYTHVTRPTMH
jgi:hypothetical protein